MALVACNTCDPNLENDISESIFERGTQNVIGFSDSIDCELANDWVIDLLNKLEDGKTPELACSELSQSNKYQDTGLAYSEVISRME